MIEAHYTLPEIEKVLEDCFLKLALDYEGKTSTEDKVSEEGFVKLCGVFYAYVLGYLKKTLGE